VILPFLRFELEQALTEAAATATARRSREAGKSARQPFTPTTSGSKKIAPSSSGIDVLERRDMEKLAWGRCSR